MPNAAPSDAWSSVAPSESRPASMNGCMGNADSQSCIDIIFLSFQLPIFCSELEARANMLHLCKRRQYAHSKCSLSGHRPVMLWTSRASEQALAGAQRKGGRDLVGSNGFA